MRAWRECVGAIDDFWQVLDHRIVKRRGASRSNRRSKRRRSILRCVLAPVPVLRSPSVFVCSLLKFFRRCHIHPYLYVCWNCVLQKSRRALLSKEDNTHSQPRYNRASVYVSHKNFARGETKQIRPILTLNGVIQRSGCGTSMSTRRFTMTHWFIFIITMLGREHRRAA